MAPYGARCGPYRARRKPIREKIANTAISATTMVEPTGVPATAATRMPATAQSTEMQAAQIDTVRKLLKTRMADSAGKTTSAEISREPTSYMARTTTTAMITAIRRL